MFALAAAAAFLLALFKAHLGGVDLLRLGLFFLALHLVYAWTPWQGRPARRDP